MIQTPPAGLLRRLGAMVYDCLPIFAFMVVATVPFLPFLKGRVLVAEEVGWLAHLYHLVQIAVVAGFFIFFWTRRGQTVGMLAWRLRLERHDGALLSVGDALRRLGAVFVLCVPFLIGYWWIWHDWPKTPRVAANCIALAPLAIAYLWIWIDRDKQAWPDRWTKTRVVLLPKRAR